MNIKIKQCKKDTCSTCDKFQIQIKMCDNGDKKKDLQQQLLNHHIEVDLGYSSKSADKDISKPDPHMKTITFDLQQCLPTPDVNNSIAFYKRQLWTFNCALL